MIPHTDWPYTFDEQVMNTEEWQMFINLYQAMNKFNLLNQPKSCEAVLDSMAIFLRENINNWPLVNECINYLSDMPWDWMKYLVLHLL